MRQTATQTGDLASFAKFAGVDFEIDGEPVLLMRDLEVMARKRAGTYALVSHLVEQGIATRTVYHEPDARCEHCPPEPRSTLLEDERARLLSERAEQGVDGVSPALVEQL